MSRRVVDPGNRPMSKKEKYSQRSYILIKISRKIKLK